MRDFEEVSLMTKEVPTRFAFVTHEDARVLFKYVNVTKQNADGTTTTTQEKVAQENPAFKGNPRPDRPKSIPTSK
jgi:hypothetical protein